MLLPAYVALRLSIPLASPGSYNRDWMTVSLMCSPLAVVRILSDMLHCMIRGCLPNSR